MKWLNFEQNLDYLILLIYFFQIFRVNKYSTHQKGWYSLNISLFLILDVTVSYYHKNDPVTRIVCFYLLEKLSVKEKHSDVYKITGTIENKYSLPLEVSLRSFL